MKIYQALPPYFGGKRRLLPWIKKHLSAVIPQHRWSNLVFLDAFAGGGSVSLFAKLHGFKQVLSNDVSSRSQIILEGLLTNPGQGLTKQDLNSFILSEPSRVITLDCLSEYHQEWLNKLHSYQKQCLCPHKKAMIQLLLWHCLQYCFCFGTSIGSSNRPFAKVLNDKAPWHELNSKRFQDGSFDSLLKPLTDVFPAIIKRLNGGLTPGNVEAFQLDAMDFVSNNKGDILYLDPPYADTLAYEDSYRVLDQLLFGENGPRAVNSRFSGSVDSISELLVASKHIPCWVLSYNDKVLGLEQLNELVKAADPNRAVQGFSKAYAHLAYVSKRDNQELLIISYNKEAF